MRMFNYASKSDFKISSQKLPYVHFRSFSFYGACQLIAMMIPRFHSFMIQILTRSCILATRTWQEHDHILLNCLNKLYINIQSVHALIDSLLSC